MDIKIIITEFFKKFKSHIIVDNIEPLTNAEKGYFSVSGKRNGDHFEMRVFLRDNRVLIVPDN